MTKFLIITQDLRIGGTSQGIIERSFLAKLRRVYSDAVIDVLYLPHFKTQDDLELLPVDSLTRRIINNKIPFHVKWINRIATRLLGVLYAENYIHKQYAKHIKKVDHSKYDHIFIRSSGLEHQSILAMHNLPILKNAIINFHDPYPYVWYKGKASKIHKNEFLRLQKMIQVVQQAKTCCASAYYMAKDLQYLYASDKFFYTLPHQFAIEAFDLSKKDNVRKKEARLQISYHGALMFGRNLFNLLEAYVQLLDENDSFRNNTEFVLRIKGDDVEKIIKKYNTVSNIKFLNLLDFSNSSHEQLYESDINVVLENGPYYCNILGGKVPFLDITSKPILIVSPERSELRQIVKNNRYLANMNSVEDIKLKLGTIIQDRLVSQEPVNLFGNYFSDAAFLSGLQQIFKSN